LEKGVSFCPEYIGGNPRARVKGVLVGKKREREPKRSCTTTKKKKKEALSPSASGKRLEHPESIWK